MFIFNLEFPSEQKEHPYIWNKVFRGDRDVENQRKKNNQDLQKWDLTIYWKGTGKNTHSNFNEEPSILLGFIVLGFLKQSYAQRNLNLVKAFEI